MADIKELGRRVKAKYPGQYDDLSDDDLGRKVKAKYPGAYDDFTDAPAAAQTPQESAYERFRRNVGIEGQRFLRKVGDTAEAAGEIVTSAFQGDFRPAREAAELAGRAAAPIVAALGGRPELAGQTYLAKSVQQAAPIAEVNAQRTARRDAGDNADYWRRSREDIARLDAEAAKDPSLSGKITRGVVGVGAEALTALLAGGSSVPGVIASGAALELNSPENIPLVVLGGAIPGAAKGLRSAAPAIERTLGKGAAQIVEAEARQGAGQLIRATGATVDQSAIRAASLPASPSAGLNAAIAEAAAEVPQSTTKRVLAEVASFPRAMMSSLDISAPGRQGLLLAASPTRWGAAIKAGGRMFQAFRKESYDKINKAIANHADAAVADDAGLYLAFKQGEELFTSKLAAKIPGVSASQRAYEVYLDSLRMDVFSKYRKVIDAQNLTGDQAQKAYQAAAKWINVATGRGSFGKRFDDAVPFLSNFLFAPRYTASRFNVLNPMMYARNFADPATRAVGKQQMKDLAGYLGLVATTYGLAKAAGADVDLNPSSRSFLKIKAGNKTYDAGAGLIQVMRFAIKVSHDMFRAAKGEKAEAFKDAGSVTLNFLRSKTAPLPSYVWDFFSRRTYEGKDFTPGQAAIGAIERVTPLTWADFSEALYNEGIGGAAATLPGALGIGVQTYTQPGGFLDQAAPLLREYTRAKRQLPEIRRIKNESDEQFNARLKVFGEALERYGVGLVESNEYRNADTATKDEMLDLLPRRISGALMKQGEAWMLAPRILLDDVKENRELKRDAGQQPRVMFDAQGRQIR